MSRSRHPRPPGARLRRWYVEVLDRSAWRRVLLVSGYRSMAPALRDGRRLGAGCVCRVVDADGLVVRLYPVVKLGRPVLARRRRRKTDRPPSGDGP